MILSFSKPEFVEKIKNNTKKHTIRLDKSDKWQVGNKIHFWKGNPRNVTKNPYFFGIGQCNEICLVSVLPSINKVVNHTTGKTLTNIISLNVFAANDGFGSWHGMKDFFKDDFHGKLIFWDYEKCSWV